MNNPPLRINAEEELSNLNDITIKCDQYILKCDHFIHEGKKKITDLLKLLVLYI